MLEVLDEDQGLEMPARWWNEEPLPEWKTWAKLIKDHVFEAILPPAAMGSGSRGLSHKAGLLAYGWRLGARDAEGLTDFAKSYVSHTSDMGI